MALFDDYFFTLTKLPSNTVCTRRENIAIPRVMALEELISLIKSASNIFAIGNGGSASIASHCASHYPRRSEMRIDTLSDISAFSATANDAGYENVYANQIYSKARPGDLLIAISSSGNSVNITTAAKIAKSRGCYVVTLTGFSEENALRSLGDLNFWVPSSHYGHVELTHMALLHAAFDLMDAKPIESDKFKPSHCLKHLFDDDGKVI